MGTRATKTTAEEIEGYLKTRNYSKKGTAERRKVLTNILIGRGKYITLESREKQFTKYYYGRVSINTHNLYKKYINNFLKFGEKQKSWIIPHNALQMQKLIKGSTSNKQVLSEEEMYRVINRSSEKYKDIVYIQYKLALRVSELSLVTWEQLQEEEKVEINNKGRVRSLIVTREIRELSEGKTGLVCSNHKTYQKYIKRLSAKIGILRLTTHSIRHYRATELSKKGIRIEVIRDILGHSNISITNTYLHSEEEEEKKAMEL